MSSEITRPIAAGRPGPARFVFPLTVALALLLPSTSRSQESAATWIPLGPEGATVTALAEASGAPGTVFAGVRDGGVFRSEDGGRSWRPARGGWAAGEVYALAIDPSLPATLLAGTERGVYRSTDAGASWSLSTEGLPVNPRFGTLFPVTALAVDLVSPLVYAGAGPRVLESRDGGRTWTDSGDDLPGTVDVLAADPSAPGRLYAGTSAGPFRSDDGGTTWLALSGGAEAALGLDRAVSALVLDASGPGGLFVALFDGAGPSLVVSRDGGDTWAAADGGLPRDGQPPVVGWRLALGFRQAGQPGRLFAGSELGVFRSDDGAAHWVRVHDPLGRAKGAAAALATRSGAVLVGFEDFVDELWDGVLRSADGGETWATVADGLLALGVRQIVPAPGASGGEGRLHALGFDGRVLGSSDGGESWQTAGGALAGVSVADLDVDPSAPDRLVATTDFGGSASAYRSVDGGVTWQPAGRDLPCCAALVAADPGGGGVFYASRPLASDVYRSADGGASWERVGELPVGERFVPSEPQVGPAGLIGPVGSVGSGEGPGRPAVVYVLGVSLGSGFGTGQGQTRLFRSADGGRRWEERSLPVVGEIAGPIRVDPRRPGVLYLAAQDALYRSTDGGGSWTVLSEVPGTLDLLFDPARPGVLYRATVGAGVLRSLDGGVTWSALGTGLVSPTVRGLAFAAGPAGGPDTLYAATRGGAWSLELASGGSTPAPPETPPLVSSEVPGFRFRVRITDQQGASPPVRRESACIPETLCVSGAVPGRTEVFLRVVGPKPNGRLWPTLVKLSTSRVEVWIEQTATGVPRYYLLPGATPGEDRLPGLFDREGFVP